jgi:hypothetical protein
VVKASKAKFGMAEIDCLGFVVGKRGVRPDPEKVEAIQTFARPLNHKQLRGFLGLLNFYGSMVPDLQRVLRPLNQALRHSEEGGLSKQLLWSGDMEDAFKQAKSLFAAQVLTALPDFKRPFIVTTDASEDGLGAVLSQVGQDGKDRPVAFFSRGIDTPEIREELESMVKTRELELYAFLCATRKWRSFLYGQRFLWLTDHKPLLWEEKNPSKKVTNWLSELKELDFEAQYIKGEENEAADALSRYAQLTPEPSARVNALTRTQRERRRVAVPQSEVPAILRRFHDNMGHHGKRKTLQAVKEQFYWPGLAGDVMKWCETCDTCQKVKPVKKGGELESEKTSQATIPFNDITMDLVQIEDQQMLVIECMFSRFVETAMLPSKSADAVFKATCDLLLDRYGIPELIRTDNGNEFSCLGAASFQLGFEWRRCSPHNPSSQGMVERANQSILDEITRLRLRKYSVDDARRMGTRIYNAKVHKATGHSPYSVVFGREPTDPDLVLEQKRHGKVDLKSKVNEWVTERTARDRRVFREALGRDDHQKAGRQVEGATVRFKVGDLVLIPRVNRIKTDPRRQGPYEVVQVRDGGIYRLKDTENFRKPRILRHHRQLVAYLPREDGAATQGEGPSQLTVQANPEQQEPKRRGRPPKPTARESVTISGGQGGGGPEAPEEPERGDEEEEARETRPPEAQSQEMGAQDDEATEPPEMELTSQELAVWVDPEEARRAHMRKLKDEAKARQEEVTEDLRRSKRANQGIPPKKYMMDLVTSWAAKMYAIIARRENWARSHLPWKTEALRRTAPHYLIEGGRSVGQAVK